MCLDQCEEAPVQQWHGQGPSGAVEARRPSEGHRNLTKEPVSTRVNTVDVQWHNAGCQSWSL
jgi:hypothetical protein